MRTLTALALAVVVVAPAVAGPPDGLVPDASATFSGGRADPVSTAPWWETLGDPQLDTVVETALRDNPNLDRSRAGVRQASGAALAAVSDLAPSVSGSARASLAPTDSLGFQFGGLPSQPGAPEPPSTYSQGSATLDATWNVDLFGRGVAGWRAAVEDGHAAEGDLADAGLATVEGVVRAYLDVVAARERVAIVEQQIETNAELLEILELRYERGDSNTLDVLQQRQQLATTQAQRPTATLALETAEQRLAVLLGRMPMDDVPTAEVLPDLPPDPAVGTPTSLVEHRPDLRAAEARIRAARHRRWSAMTGLLPTVGLSATAGWQYFDLNDYTDQTYWNAGANVSVPIFNGGRNLGQVRQARAAVDAQEAAYRSAVLQAVQQVEGALSQERARAEAVSAQQAQLDAADAAWRAARDQYLEGLTPFLNVINALGRRQSAELQLLQGRRDLLGARIALHQAIGGPWATGLASSSEVQR